MECFPLCNVGKIFQLNVKVISVLFPTVQIHPTHLRSAVPHRERFNLSIRCSIWLGSVLLGCVSTMANGGDAVKVKSLANWTCWWSGTSLPMDLAKSFHTHVDPTKLPKEGRLITLLTPGKVTMGDLQDFHKGKLAEAMLHVYPGDKDPSAYLLADSVLHLDIMLSHSVLGRPSNNPMEEKSRRDRALKDGSNLKLLLSYIRNSSGRHEKGRVPCITYLKELAVSKHKAKRVRSPAGVGSTASSSPPSPSSSTCTTILDGNPPSDYSISPFLVFNFADFSW